MIATHIVLTFLVAGAVLFSMWRFPPPTWGVMQTVGICLLTVGLALWTVARFQLGKSFTVRAQAKGLVTRGLYSKIRNPIYVFGSCVIAGWILVLGRPKWLVVFIVLIPLQIWRAGKESKVLEATFGEEYQRYRAGTWL